MEPASRGSSSSGRSLYDAIFTSSCLADAGPAGAHAVVLRGHCCSSHIPGNSSPVRLDCESLSSIKEHSRLCLQTLLWCCNYRSHPHQLRTCCDLCRQSKCFLQHRHQAFSVCNLHRTVSIASIGCHRYAYVAQSAAAAQSEG